MTSSGTALRSVIVFGEGVFQGESLVVHPRDSHVSGQVNVPLFPPKDVPVDLHVKVGISQQKNQ